MMIAEVWTKSGYRHMSEQEYADFVANPPPTTEYHQRGLPIPLVSLPFILFCVFILGVGLGMGIA